MADSYNSKFLDDPEFQSLLVGCLESLQRGETIDLEALKRDFPLYAEELGQFVNNLQLLEQVASGLGGVGPSHVAIPVYEQTAAMKTEPCDFTTGESIRYIGEYEILEEIARGGMGVVFKARQRNLERVVALKMILAGRLADASDVQRFYREARAAGKLMHPAIVPVHEIGEHDGRHYFTMDYVEGRSLAEMIREETLAPRAAAKLVQDIAEAVQFAHEQGTVHRDLKPANVLLDQANQPHVTDFGLAKIIESVDEKSLAELTTSGQILGTPSYMSPEQAEGKQGQVGPAADIYSLGAILYACLTGRAPFLAESPVDTLMQVIHKEPVSPRQLNPKVPQDLETICLKCLEKSPDNRYVTAHDLEEELQRFLDGKPIMARPLGRFVRIYRWCRRKPIHASLISSLMIILVVGLLLIQAKRQYDLMESRTELISYAEQLSRSKSELRSGKSAQAYRILDETDPELRSIEFNLLNAQLLTQNRPLVAPAHEPRDFSDNLRIEAVTLKGTLWKSPRRLCVSNTETAKIETEVSISDVDTRKENTPFFRAARLLPTGELLISVKEHPPLPIERNEKPWNRLVVYTPTRGANPPVNRTLGRLRFDKDVLMTSDGTIAGGIPESGKGLVVWDVRSGEILFERNDYTPGTGGQRIALSQNGDYLGLVHSTDESNVEIVNLKTGESVFLSGGNGSRIAISNDGTKFASARRENIKIKSTDNDILLGELDGIELATMNHFIFFSQDGEQLAFTTSKQGACVFDWKASNPATFYSGFSAIQFSPDQSSIITQSGDRYFELSLQEEQQQILRHPAATGLRKGETITELQLSRDGRRLLSSDVSGTHFVWNTTNGQLINQFKGLSRKSSSISSNGDSLAYVVKTEDRELLQIVDSDTAQKQKEYGPFKNVKCLGFTNADLIAFIYFSYTGEGIESNLVVANWGTGEQKTISGVDIIHSWQQDRNGHLTTLELPFTPQLKSQITQNPFPEFQYKARYYDLKSRNILWSVSHNEQGVLMYTPCVAISQDGSLVAMSIFLKDLSKSMHYKQTQNADNEEDNLISVRDGYNGRLRGKIPMTTVVKDLCFSTDNDRIIVAGRDGLVSIFDVETGIKLFTAEITSASPSSLELSTDGKKLYVGDVEGNITIVTLPAQNSQL